MPLRVSERVSRQRGTQQCGRQKGGCTATIETPHSRITPAPARHHGPVHPQSPVVDNPPGAPRLGTAQRMLCRRIYHGRSVLPTAVFPYTYRQPSPRPPSRSAPCTPPNSTTQPGASRAHRNLHVRRHEGPRDSQTSTHSNVRRARRATPRTHASVWHIGSRTVWLLTPRVVA